MKKYVAEMIGTMVLVLMGCGSAVFAGAGQPFASVGTLGVAFAFGLTVLAMVYTIGKISGCHINPAITLGMLLSKKISGKDAGLYMVFQVVLGSTSKGANTKFAGIAIGLALVLIHIVCIPITGTSVNPARSIGPALFQGGEALSQLWLFIIAPFLGAAIAAVVWKGIDTEEA